VPSYAQQHHALSREAEGKSPRLSQRLSSQEGTQVTSRSWSGLLSASRAQPRASRHLRGCPAFQGRAQHPPCCSCGTAPTRQPDGKAKAAGRGWKPCCECRRQSRHRGHRQRPDRPAVRLTPPAEPPQHIHSSAHARALQGAAVLPLGTRQRCHLNPTSSAGFRLAKQPRQPLLRPLRPARRTLL